MADALDLELTAVMRVKLDRLQGWLATEAITAGGLGRGEASQIEERHLADSLMYAGGWLTPPSACVDLGSGVGLPGLVLAVVWPETRFTLLDRSQGRCDLARRAARIAAIEAEVVRGEIFEQTGAWAAVVSRAAIPARQFAPLLDSILSPGGRAVVSGDGSVVEGFTNLKIHDQPSRLLMMQKS
ncbi:hypothetical protein BH18ACT5_BH18ACT5_01170 [soil metagenome]